MFDQFVCVGVSFVCMIIPFSKYVWTTLMFVILCVNVSSLTNRVQRQRDLEREIEELKCSETILKVGLCVYCFCWFAWQRYCTHSTTVDTV